MVSQPRLMQPSGAASAPRPPGRPPLVAPALQPLQSLPRLLAVILLTGLVVLVWSLRDEPAPSATAPGAPGITLIGGGVQAAPTAEIAAPQGASVPIQGPTTLSADDAAAVDLPRLRPNALPRPPELVEPIQPGRFIRFTAQPGDTIYDVSIVYGVTIDEILRFNPALGDGTQIRVGQLIFVPAD